MTIDPTRRHPMRRIPFDPATLEDRRELQTEWIPANQLHIDTDYQRKLDLRRVKRLAEAWDDRACGTLIVNVRSDGAIAVVDGQHRLRAFEKARGPLAAIPCTVYYGLSPQEEAGLFAHVNGRMRRQPSPMDTMRARVQAGDPVALDIVNVITEVGLTVNWSASSNSRRGAITAISAAERIYQRGGRTALLETLRVLRSIWADDENAYVGAILDGMFVFLTIYRTQLDYANLIEKLSMHTPRTVLRRSQTVRELGLSSGNPGKTIAMAVRDIYNAGKRSNRTILPELPVYVSQKEYAERWQ